MKTTTQTTEQLIIAYGAASAAYALAYDLYVAANEEGTPK